MDGGVPPRLPCETSRRPLVLSPFRGLRYDPALVGDVGTVVAPPYDTLDADTVRRLESANPHNVVRLILSRRFERPYLAVRRRLDAWRSEGVLRADEEPALYLYEYDAHGLVVRGLIGLLSLRDESEGVILPHEDVMAAPVEDRTVLMRTTRTNLEPILLVHEGSPNLRRLLDRVALRRPDDVFTGPDDSRHRVWLITNADDLDAVAHELAPGRALIADGHHRYAAYRALAAENADGAPWQAGLAMLVDQRAQPLRIGPIHRVVAGLTLRDVLDAADASGHEWSEGSGPDDAFGLGAGERAHGRTPLVLSDGHRWGLLAVKSGLPLGTAVLHEELLPVWDADEGQVSYHHDLGQAVRMLHRHPGVLVGLEPPGLGQVLEAAEGGRRLPRKSTSFFPKPLMGVVMRDLSDG